MLAKMPFGGHSVPESYSLKERAMTDQTVTDNLLYQQLDEYRLEALLGQGGMARVYRGFDVRLKRWTAIKVIDAPFPHRPGLYRPL